MLPGGSHSHPAHLYTTYMFLERLSNKGIKERRRKFCIPMAKHHLMRTIYGSRSLLSSFLSSQSKTRPSTQVQNRSKPVCLSVADFHTEVQKEDIVIVGGGIAGLATAASLHRSGIKSLVLEQADSLRTSGAALGLMKNAWKALDAVGVGDLLRSQFFDIDKIVIKTEKGKELRSLGFKDEDKSHEMRAVDRKVLLQTLADQLPSNTIQFSSKLSKIGKAETTGETLLELVNGTQLSAKVVIGCDGIRSPVAKWMGFREPKYAGHCAIRGLTFYPNGQPHEPKINYFYGRGTRAGYVPISPTKVYWFIVYNSIFPGPRVTDPCQLKKQSLDLVKNWPSDLLDLIDSTSEDTIILSPLQDRWLWPVISPPASRDGIVLTGDAWHPMTPNLGQGGCCALEDAVVLSKKLSAVIKYGKGSIEEALKSYEKERWRRVFRLSIHSNFVGKFLQSENEAICSFRNNVVLPKLLKPRALSGHTDFDF